MTIATRINKVKLPIAVLEACLLIASAKAQTPENLDFLSDLPDFKHARDMLPDYLNRIGISLLEERKREVARFSSPDDVAKRRAYLRERMLRAIGGLPQRTPLNARVVGVLDRAGYKVEKVIFESQPRLYVTGNLYLPKTGQPPYPGVLFPLGHERGAKANAGWQQMLATLAKRGYVGFAWDPIGQGERVQLYDTDLEEPKVSMSTTEHTILGIQCLLVGDSVARYTIWDGIRALDFLLSRKEVDPTRIACTGNSGGGTHTAYLSALDDRIQVAAPSCYLTSWRRLLLTIGPQDAEQCLPPWLDDKLDHADFVLAFAPKPYLILSAIRDFFSISGARETYEEAQRTYALMGAQEKLSMFEADDGHGYTKPRRLAAYAWLSRWLKGSEDRAPEEPVDPASEEELRCTDSGQVTVSLGGETVFSLNLQRFEQGKPARTPLSSPEAVAANKDKIQRQVSQLTGFESRRGQLNVKPFGRIEREGYRIEKLVYESEPGIIVPALLIVPEAAEGRRPAVIYVHEDGKKAGADSGGEVEQLVKSGFVVLAIDTRGSGETRPPENEEQAHEQYRFFGHYDSAMTALLVGKTLVGMRANDISRGIDLLALRPEVDNEKIYGFGVGAGALSLLHEAVADERVKKVVFKGMLLSYEAVVTHRIHRGVFESVIPGVLKVYDLQDLVAALAPRPVWIVNAKDPLGKQVAIGEVRKQFVRSVEAFKTLGAEEAIQIAVAKPEERLEAIYRGLR